MNWQALAPLRTPGAILALIGGILILVPQAYMIQWYLALTSVLPLLPPESVPGAQFLLQVLLVTIAVAVACGIAVLVDAIIVIPRRSALGGFLVLVFATPAFVVTGIPGWIGGALAIVGGVLALLSSVRPPQKGRSRKPASS
jgi:hypothetical protein